MLPQLVQYQPQLLVPVSPPLTKRQNKREENHVHHRAHHVAQEALVVRLGALDRDQERLRNAPMHIMLVGDDVI